jgi:hypothetical protein
VSILLGQKYSVLLPDKVHDLFGDHRGREALPEPQLLFTPTLALFLSVRQERTDDIMSVDHTEGDTSGETYRCFFLTTLASLPRKSRARKEGDLAISPPEKTCRTGCG